MPDINVALSCRIVKPIYWLGFALFMIRLRRFGMWIMAKSIRTNVAQA